MKKLPALFLALIFSITTAYGQSTTWKVEDVVNQESAHSLEFSPDGKAIVWVKRRPDKEKDRFINDLYLTRLDVKSGGTFKTIQLTRGDESDYSPLFSKDGETIYFLSSREKGDKLWAMSIYGGEPYQVHTFDSGISGIRWLDEQTLAFESNEGKTLYEQQLEEEEDNTVVVEDTAHYKPSRIYAFDLKNKEIKRLTDNRFPVGEFEVSPDGTWLITSHILSPDYVADANPKPTYYLWNLKDGSKQQILKEGYQTPGNFEFTEDSKGIYFVSVKSSDPQWNGAGITLMHHYDIADKQVQDVPVEWELGLGGGFDLVGNDVLVSLANRTTVKLIYMERTGGGWNRKTVDAGNMDEHVTVVSVADDNQTVAYVYSTASMPPQYRIAKLNEKRRSVALPRGEELISLNSHFDKKTKAKTEVVTWTGALEDTITGILYYPHNYQPGRKYPLIVDIHGGPAGVDTDRWGESWASFSNIYAQKGAFVFMPNYHGSAFHGLEFVESIKGHYYEYEIPDIITGIDMLVDKGLVDPDSLGIKGWSNGAILTTMTTLQHPDLFKAAAPGAGDVNWTSDYGTCRFGVQFDQSYFIGAPWDDTNGQIFNETYITKSPLFEMEKIKTPTIIFHGSEDRAVPRDQGWEYYRALHQIGKAPVRFLWFPGQPHSLRKLTHQKRKMEEEIRWFDIYLFGTHEPENETFKKDSPLAAMLKMKEVKMHNSLYGEMKNGILIPETMQVKEDSISIGRFEVTNAQYAAFDAQHSFPRVRANYPVTGIGYEKASAYVKWLSGKTGESYRLPNKTEGEALHKQAKKAADKENTLNYWAGYDITIDEIPEFRLKIEQLHRTLLKEAGSYRGTEVGNALVYDLGGNAAEYYAGGDTSVYGYSAVSYVDDRGEMQPPPAAYIGLRVVRE
ncbi:MAG: prolyl oligopeptidase family serine peptidase [Balneolaceae bacterium]|nr:prolyl oligopeptidase family serine peptidase [Balneolaceae bacterium]